MLLQYHQGQVTVPRLVTQLRALGIAISKRQVVRLLNAGQGAFLDEARAVLRAGLETAPWISVFPGLAIMGAVLAFNLLGDGLRDILDPRSRPV